MKIFQVTAVALVIASMSIGNLSAQTNTPSTGPSGHVHLPGVNPQLPTLFLIGDSTVRNGHGTGTGGQWGWGDFLAPYFDTNKICVAREIVFGSSAM